MRQNALTVSKDLHKVPVLISTDTFILLIVVVVVQL